jgi:hypothetical protein
MSLLDDVSIVVTPNGYKAGELYAVVPVPTEGSEEITNGDFATDSDWGLGTGWSISGGTANCIGGAGSLNLTQVALEIGKRYTVTYTVLNYSQGTVQVKMGGWTQGTLNTSNGTYTEVISNDHPSANTTIYIQGKSDFIGSIDNVSVKEYTAADMDVTRATAATRVDEAGLVNYAEVIGGEEVVNGDFANGTDDFTEESNSTISVGTHEGRTNVADISITDTATASRISQPFTYVSGQTYIVTAEVFVVSGSFRIDCSNLFYNGDFVSTSTTGSWITLTGYITAAQSGTNAFWQRGILGNEVSQFYVDSVSIKEVTRDNVPRIDYTGGGCPHILAEPQRTNLFTYSEDFSQWTNINSTDTANYSTAPDGDNTATRLLTTSQDSSYLYINSLTISDSTAYTMSIYVKSNGNGLDDFRLYTTTGGTSANLTATTEWQRFDYNLTSTTTWTNIGIRGVGGQETDVLVWGAQMEEGSYQTSLIPTSGSTVTRNQDQFSRDGISSLINSEEGVLFVEAATTFDSSTSRRITLSDGSTSNRVSLEFDDSVENKIKAFISLDGSSQILNYTATDLSQFNKIAIKWKVNDFAIWFNGVEVATDSFGSTPVGLNQVSFGDGANGNTFYGKVKQLQVYKTALTDTQLAALTS